MEILFHKVAVDPCLVSNLTDMDLGCWVSAQMPLHTACQSERLYQTWGLSNWHRLNACGTAMVHNITA